MEDPTTWKTDAKVWRGWWDVRGWFWLIRDFGFRGALAHVRWTTQNVQSCYSRARSEMTRARNRFWRRLWRV